MTKRIDRIGETNIAANGMTIKIVTYRSAHDLDVTFEDGTIVTNEKFKKGQVGLPKKYQTIKIGQIAYHVGDIWAFYVKCEKCGLSDIMTYEQMQAHSCCQN